MNSVERIKEILVKKDLKLSVGESCTGGLISSYLTDIDGASEFVEINFVTYSSFAKMRFLKVPKVVIDHFGVVSSQTAECMAKGLLLYSGISIATTGYASRCDDPKYQKGFLYFAFAYKDKVKVLSYQSLKEERVEIKKDMAEHILYEFCKFLDEIFD